MIQFHCEHCGQKLRVPGTSAGKPGRCPVCKGRITVPQAPTSTGPLAEEEAVPTVGTLSKSLDQALFDLPSTSAAAAPPPAPAEDEGVSADEENSHPVRVLLLYPLNLSGIIHMLIFSLLPPLWAQAATLQFWMSPGIGVLFWLVLLTLYFVHYLAICLTDSAAGGTRAVDINSDSSPLTVDALLSTFQTVFPAVALVWGPVLAYYVIQGGADWVFILWAATAGFLFPMVLLSVHYFDSLRGASPHLILPSIASVLIPYSLLVACLSVPAALIGLLMCISGRPYGGWIARPPIIYAFLVGIHLLGRFYRRYQERLNWGI
jgi:hypothetical protein